MKGIAKITIKILSLYLLIEFITESIPQIFGIINSGQSIRTGIIVGILIAQILKFIFALFLWFSAEKLSNFMISNKNKDPIKNINYRYLHLISFSVIGIVILALSIPDLVQYLLEYFNISGRVLTNILPKIVAKIIEIILGLWLLIKPDSFAKKIKITN